MGCCWLASGNLYCRAMSKIKRLLPGLTKIFLAFFALAGAALFAVTFRAHGQEKSGFPDGYDAIQTAPDTHKVIFENSLVRVLEVTVPPPGKTIPFHHHRWPSFFLRWDMGGRSPHIRYHRVSGTVIDQPSHDEPTHAGKWAVQWMKPEPMHSIEVVEPGSEPKPNEPADLRIEIKCLP